MSILIKNALVVAQDRQRSIANANILVEGNTIKYVGIKEYGADRVIEAKGMIAMPGLINTHTHVAMSRFKGLLDDISLEGFLDKTFKLDAQRSESDIYRSAMLGIKEMIDSGITSFLDLYYSEEIIAKAAKSAGIRAFLSWVTLDEQYTTQRGNPLRNADRFIQKFKNDKLISPSVGIQGVYVASDETMLKAKELSEKYGTLLHMHLAETSKEVSDYLGKTGERPAEHIVKIGIVSERLVAAHCIWLSRKEMKGLAKSRANASWNQISNSKLASGSMKVREMLSMGINVALGTDSSGSNNSLNMFEAMKYSALHAKSLYGDATAVPAQKILDMATVDAARALGRNDIGSIEIGKLADIVLLDARKPNLLPTNKGNVVNNIVYSANPSNVSYVIINGKIVKETCR
ncbi:MAG: amidohydrolase family protein [Candidatus Micrarchaeia archaeon]